ncbi:Isocitrate dehydrogenase [NAD] subunit beta, mitochondrial [Tupaia chinensis]|uniref:Isocitrate dehydrogenase [NAD] subunit beta, mitochondrial n=1 Tax=Tupaia chinensis TaxID=246437 RepID=L9L775_TUPCH|nr:Isocitrate dehydrogenase [NAD] subunit beta, mitochondrial [Tupaia chinensis]
MEGEYNSLEHESVRGMIECLKIITRAKSQWIAKFAFDCATKKGWSKVTAVLKANIMKLGDGLFLQYYEKVAELYPQIKFETIIIDNCCRICTSLMCWVCPVSVGTLSTIGLLAWLGELAWYPAVGRNIANPIAILLSASNMLQHLSLEHHSSIIADAVKKVIKVGKVRTQDMGSYSTTVDFIKSVIGLLDLHGS